MSKETHKVSLNMDTELYARVQDLVDSTPNCTFTSVTNTLIQDGFDLRQKVQEQEHMLNLVNLKTLFYMRELVRTRGEDVLSKFDQKFQEELPTLRALIMENGIDYGNS